MGRTLASVFWIASIIWISEAGIPLSLRCSSRPTLSTFSRSPGPPFLSAESHLTFLPSFIPAGPSSDSDADDIPEPKESKVKNVVILHKVNKYDDEDIEIIIKKRKKRPKEEQPLTEECIDNDDSCNKNEMIDKTVINQDDEESSIDEKTVDKKPEDEKDSPEEDEENHDVVEDTYKEKVLSDKQEKEDEEEVEAEAESLPDENN